MMHDSTEECAATHCFIHQVDEPDGFRRCFECAHAYATPEALITEHNRVVDAIRSSAFVTTGDAADDVVSVPYAPTVADVTCCPVCVHDW